MQFPEHFNGIALHDTPGAETAAWGYEQSLVHARELRQRGVTAYKFWVDTDNKVERVRAYIDEGILPILRFSFGPHWGRPPSQWVPPADQIQPYRDVGAVLIEIGNEWNIACEWVISIPGPTGIARHVVDAWEVTLRRQSEVLGIQALFPSNTPGGNVDHRACYRAIIVELRNRGLLDSVKHVAVHPRPHNNPPDTPWTAINTVTFDEWRWIRDQFHAVGVEALYWATEHGYSVGDVQNANYPRIDLNRHTQYNRELQLRMNPAHPKAVEPELAATGHWFNAAWGHYGAWAKDSLVDSIVPEMPAPSPLWIIMGQQPHELAFSRYIDQPVPPPPPPPLPPTQRAEGIDVSVWQQSGYTSGIDWEALETAGFSFTFIRQSVGRTLDACCFFHANKAGQTDILRGSFHFLKPEHGQRQARLAWSIYNDLGFKMPLAVDVEALGLNARIVRGFMERWCELSNRRLLTYTSRYLWHKLVGRGATWAAELSDLWVAHSQTDEPALPDVWDSWLFWQYGTRMIPGYHKKVGRDVFNGTEAELRTLYGNGLSPQPPYTITLEHRSGLSMIVGNYPVGGIPITVTDPWGNQKSTTTGDKPAWGLPGGFELWATPSYETYTLTVEGWDYEVPTQNALTFVTFVPSA